MTLLADREPTMLPDSPKTATRRRSRPWFVVGCGLAAVGVLLLLLYAGGALRAGAGHGASSSGSEALSAATGVALLGVTIASIATVGWLLVPAILLDTSGGPLDATQRRCLRPAAVCALVWALFAGLALVLMVADGLGGSLREAIDPAVISAYVGEVEQAKALLYTALIALAVAVLTPGTRGSGSATAVLAGALLALVLPSVYGHANAGHARGASVFAAPVIGVHVAAMSVWIGGLLVLFLLNRRDRAAVTTSLPRFSALALGCFLAVGVSGAVSAATRVKTTNALLETNYGRVILLKVVLFALLGGFGYLQRRRVMRRLLDIGTSAVFRRIAACEVLLMVVTVAVAVALSRTPPPAG